MKRNFLNLLKLTALAFGVASVAGCVVAPAQPLGYRMTSTMLPTYVNGQYIGMQASGYTVPAAQVAAAAPAPVLASAAPATAAPVPATAAVPVPAANPQPVVMQQQAPVYLQSPAPTVVYVQAPVPLPVPLYGYDPYYYPGYIAPLYGPSIGIGFSWGYRRGWHHR